MINQSILHLRYGQNLADLKGDLLYTCSKKRLIENVFPLTPAQTPALTLTLKHNTVFGLTK